MTHTHAKIKVKGQIERANKRTDGRYTDRKFAIPFTLSLSVTNGSTNSQTIPTDPLETSGGVL